MPTTQSQIAADVDSATTAQDASSDDLLTDDQLAKIASPAGSRPFLRDNTVLRVTKGRLPNWVAGWENWVYLLLLAGIAAGLWWYFKKHKA